MKRDYKYFFWILIFLVVFIKIIAALYTIYEPDLIFYQNWGYVGANFGLDKIYSIINQPYFSPPNYPPLIPFLLSGTTLIYKLFFGNPFIGDAGFIYILKILPIIFDVCCSYIIYKIVLKLGATESKAKLAFILFLVSPANIVVSSLWGQTDSIVTFFLLLGFFYLLKNQWPHAWISFAIAILSKQQAIMALPIFLLISIKNLKFKKTLWGILTAIVVTILFFSPYIINGSFLIAFKRIAETGRWAPIVSFNAFNFWWLFLGKKSLTTSDLILPFILGIELFAMSYFIVIKSTINKIKYDSQVVSFAVFLSLFAFFIFPTQIHERYMYYSLPFLLIYSMFNNKFFKYFIILQVTFFLNLVLIFPHPRTDFVTIPIAIINVIVFIFCFKYFLEINGQTQINKN